MELSELELKRRGLVLDLWKFIIGTVVLGLLSLYINDVIQRKKIDLELSRNESEHLSKFVPQYLALPDFDSKKEFLEFMITISYTQQTRERYQALLDSITDKIQKKRELLEEIKEVEKRVEDKPISKKAIDLEREIVKLEESKGNNAEDVDQKKKQLEKIVADNPDIATLQELNLKVTQLDNSYAAFKQVIVDTATVKSKPGYRIIEDYKSQWLKEGHWRIYNKRYLAVNNLDNKRRTVTFQLRRSEIFNEEVVETFQLKPGQKENLDDGNFRFEIELTRIGSAGSYPLPKAAIYSVKVFLKQ